MVNLRIDKNGKDPAYLQIKDQISRLIADGMLSAGTRLPSVRQLATTLGVSKNTVNVAYAELIASDVLESRRGSGVYVNELLDVATGVNLSRRVEMSPELSDFPPMRWDPYFFASEFFGMPVTQPGNRIRFTQAYPDPTLFPFDKIKQVASNMLWSPQEFFFDIGHAQGHQPLVEYLEKQMALAGVPMAPGQNDIILTSGFQRAVSLLLDYLVKPGQKVAIESPSYSGILNILIAKRVDYVPIPVDSKGIDTEYLAGVMNREDIKALIVTPTFHNPTGVTMTIDRREHLLRLAMQRRIPVIEDDWGRLLRYEGADQPPLKALDPGGYVIHIGTFSKCFMPGLRLGWITCPADLSIQLLRAKIGADLGDSHFLQALVYDFIHKGHFERHLRKSNKEYKARRDAMCQTLSRNLPEGCRFRTPQGGFCVWIELPEGLMSAPLFKLAKNRGVEFIPATFVMPHREDAPAFRLSFSRNSVDEIKTGVERLCAVIRDCVTRPQLLQSEAVEYEDLYR